MITSEIQDGGHFNEEYSNFVLTPFIFGLAGLGVKTGSNLYDNAKMSKWRAEDRAKKAVKQVELDKIALEKRNAIISEKQRIEAEYQLERKKLFAKDPAKEEQKRKEKIVKGGLFIGIPVILVGIMIWATNKK